MLDKVIHHTWIECQDISDRDWPKVVLVCGMGICLAQNFHSIGLHSRGTGHPIRMDRSHTGQVYENQPITARGGKVYEYCCRNGILHLGGKFRKLHTILTLQVYM